MNTLDDIRAAVGTVPWDLLAHAYGRSREAPEMLSTFIDATSRDTDLAEAKDWLVVSVLHQGNIYSASIPTVWLLCELLRISPEHPAAPEILEAPRFSRPLPPLGCCSGTYNGGASAR